MTAIIFDTETTGIRDPEIIEASWMAASFSCSEEDRDWPTLQYDWPVTKRYRPKTRITMGAMAVHHIMDEDLVECPPSSSFKLPENIKYIIGHNVDFDWVAAGRPDGIRRIDTLCIARKFWPKCDSHSLGALTYFLFRSTARTELQFAHSAETDVLLTGALLKEIVRKSNSTITNFDQLWQLSETSRIPETMPFGKHKGEFIRTLPADYKAWLLRQDDLDPYLIKALNEA